MPVLNGLSNLITGNEFSALGLVRKPPTFNAVKRKPFMASGGVFKT